MMRHKTISILILLSTSLSFPVALLGQSTQPSALAGRVAVLEAENAKLWALVQSLLGRVNKLEGLPGAATQAASPVPQGVLQPSEKLVGTWNLVTGARQLAGEGPPKVIEFFKDGTTSWDGATGKFNVVSEENPKVLPVNFQFTFGAVMIDFFVEGDGPNTCMLTDHNKTNFSHYRKVK